MLRSNKLLLFTGKLVLFVVLIALLFTFLAAGYNRLVVQISNKILAFLEHPYQRTILKAEEEDVQMYLRLPGREPLLVFTQGGYELYYNLILLLALFLATTSPRLLKRFKLILIALGAIFAFHVLDLTILAKSVFQTRPMVFLTFLEPVVPILLWGLLTFRYWLPKPKAVKVGAKEKGVRPNDPCPCGSGKKYKYCCGRQSR